MNELEGPGLCDKFTTLDPCNIKIISTIIIGKALILIRLIEKVLLNWFRVVRKKSI